MVLGVRVALVGALAVRVAGLEVPAAVVAPAGEGGSVEWEASSGMARVVTVVVVAGSAAVVRAVQVVWVVRVEMRVAWVVMGAVPVAMGEALVAWVVLAALVGLAGTAHRLPLVLAALVGLEVVVWLAAASPCQVQLVLAPAQVVAAGAAGALAAWVGLEA